MEPKSFCFCRMFVSLLSKARVFGVKASYLIDVAKKNAEIVCNEQFRVWHKADILFRFRRNSGRWIKSSSPQRRTLVERVANVRFLPKGDEVHCSNCLQPLLQVIQLALCQR